jgi:hypothetical protein
MAGEGRGRLAGRSVGRGCALGSVSLRRRAYATNIPKPECRALRADSASHARVRSEGRPALTRGNGEPGDFSRHQSGASSRLLAAADRELADGRLRGGGEAADADGGSEAAAEAVRGDFRGLFDGSALGELLDRVRDPFPDPHQRFTNGGGKRESLRATSASFRPEPAVPTTGQGSFGLLSAAHPLGLRRLPSGLPLPRARLPDTHPRFRRQSAL